MAAEPFMCLFGKHVLRVVFAAKANLANKDSYTEHHNLFHA